ncbi:MAG: hypothetical protein Q4E33_01720 [Erysipelotrichaceae bacterium]|nr:hypothetical protein [Erysipelotrichaceae bacterium]
MNKILKKLFEYQKFEENQKLKNVITASEQYGEAYLTDEQLSFVFGGRSEDHVKKIEDKKADDKQ